MSDELHPILRDPERLRAYELLKSQPTGTERGWATVLGWNNVRVRRFIAALERQRLVSVTRTRYGSRLKFDTRSIPVAQPLHTRSTGVAKPLHLDLKKEREILDQGATGETDNYASDLIEAMNDVLCEHPWYRPIRSDNKSSIDSAGRIRQAGVPLERAIEVLQLDARKFNPSKHGRGEPPRSLAYFERGILDKWRAEQTALPLLEVQRPARRGDRGKSVKPEAIADVLESFDWRKALGGKK